MHPLAEYRRSPAKLVSLITRPSLLVLLVITLMAVSALTACETGHDAINPPTATPTTTAIPAPTVSETSSKDSAYTTPPTQAVGLSTSTSGSEELFIIAQDSELIQLDLNAGDTLKVSYFTSATVIGTSTASPPPPPIEFLILDPANEPLLEVGGLGENSVEVQVAITGIHRLVFTNPARLQGHEVPVEYAINP